MKLYTKLFLLLAFVAAVVAGCGAARGTSPGVDVAAVQSAAPAEPAGDQSLMTTKTAVFAGGCFWGVEAVFEHVKGVIDVKSGYAGGEAKTAKYDLVSEGDTGHAESVQVTYDPAKVSYVQLLTIFFAVAHNPT